MAVAFMAVPIMTAVRQARLAYMDRSFGRRSPVRLLLVLVLVLPPPPLRFWLWFWLCSLVMESFFSKSWAVSGYQWAL